MKKQLTYLVCPLNWGLGHASRMIPIVHDLLKQRHKVILGGDGDALKLMSQEFPQLKCIPIPDIKVSFHYKWMIVNLLLLVPKIIRTSIIEHKALETLCNTNTIDVIISDNRYGLWHKHIKSIFVTHQIMVKLPKPFQLFEYFTHLIIKKSIHQFNECWIPDYKDNDQSLSGDLSHKYTLPNNAIFIGPLSRYNIVEKTNNEISYDIIAILSGPEPLRSQLEKKLHLILHRKGNPALIIQGNPNGNGQLVKHNHVSTISHLTASEIKSLLSECKLIICRSGYTSIMDLHLLKCSAILIPTPQQTEQEYLAKHLNQLHVNLAQKKLSIESLDSFDF